MGGNDEKGMTLCLLICNITSTPPMNNHLVPENHRAYYYRARLLPSLWSCCRSHSQRPGSEAQKSGMPAKALSHESSSNMWHFTENSGNEWMKISAPVSHALSAESKCPKAWQTCRTAAVRPKGRALCKSISSHQRVFASAVLFGQMWPHISAQKEAADLLTLRNIAS